MKYIINVVDFIVGIVIDTIEMIINIFSVGISTVKSVIIIVSSLPTMFSVFLIAILSVSIIYKFMSKGGSGD